VGIVLVWRGFYALISHKRGREEVEVGRRSNKLMPFLDRLTVSHAFGSSNGPMISRGAEGLLTVSGNPSLRVIGERGDVQHPSHNLAGDLGGAFLHQPDGGS
jgi:hypothetical protein